MARLVTLFSIQWGDLSLEEICSKTAQFGYDGLEIATPSHLDVCQTDPAYYQSILDTLAKHNLQVKAISAHLAGQAVCDKIDFRHKDILPPHVWGDGDPAGVNARAAEEVIRIGRAAKALGIDVVTGFTGSPIWQYLYSFPPVSEEVIEDGYKIFAERFIPILDEYQKMGVKFALEVHPTEIAFDIETARRALKALDYHPAFGFNYDPSHLGYQGVDYVKFIYEFADRIFHVHMKDVYWSKEPTTAGVFGGHVTFGDPCRFWNFRSMGHGCINFEEIIRALNYINYQGPLSVEWEDSGMDREHGARESCEFVKRADFKPSAMAFDSSFAQ